MFRALDADSSPAPTTILFDLNTKRSRSLTNSVWDLKGQLRKRAKIKFPIVTLTWLPTILVKQLSFV